MNNQDEMIPSTKKIEDLNLSPISTAQAQITIGSLDYLKDLAFRKGKKMEDLNHDDIIDDLAAKTPQIPCTTGIAWNKGK